MATNIEQIFRDFVMNKIREIEGEGLHTGVTTEGHSNGSVQYSVERTGFGKEVALVMENRGDVYEHPCSAEVVKCAENAQTENTASVDMALSKEGSMMPHKKNKKHKRHKSRKKKKHKEEREGTSESGLESGAECHARVKGLCPGREGVAEDDRAAVVGVPTDQPMEEIDGRPKRHKHATKKKKKKKKKDEEKHEKKSPPRSRSESSSGSESVSKSPSKMPPISYPVVPLEKNQESSSFGSTPKKSPKKLSKEMTPVQCEVFVQVSEQDSEAVGIHEVVSSQKTVVVATNVIDNQVNIAKVLDLPDIVPKVENAHKEEGRVDSFVQKDTEENSESMNKERGPCCSQTPKQTIDKSDSRRVCSSSRSSSRRRSSPRKRHSRSRSRRRKSQTSSVNRSEQKSSPLSSRKWEHSYSRFCMRYRRSRSRSRHSSQSRSTVQRRSHSGSFSMCRRSRSRSKRSQSRQNQRSRPARRARHSRSRSRLYYKRSHSRKSCSRSVRRTRQTRSRSIVILRHSRSRSLFRRNRRSRSRSLRQICSRSRSARRRQSKSHSPQRSRHSRSTPRARQRRSQTLSPRCSKKSRSPIRRCHSKSPCGSQKQSKSPKKNRQSMSRSPTKYKSKCRSISGFTLSCEKRPLLTEEKKVSGSPTRELGDSDIPITEIHASGCNADKRDEEDAVYTAKTVQCMNLKGSHLKEETPAYPSDLKLENAFEEFCTDNENKIASSVGSWRPVPFLMDSNAKPKPISATESLGVFTSAAVTLTELSEECKCPTMEKTPLTPSTSWDLSYETSKDHLQNSKMSSLSEDVGKESDLGCRSYFPQWNSEPTSPLNRKKSPFKEGLSSVSPSSSRKKHSKSRSHSKRKKSVSTRRKHSRSNSSPRRRRSQSILTNRRKKSKSRSPGRKKSPSQSWGQNKSKSPRRGRRSRSKLKKSRSKSIYRSTKRKRSKSRTPVQKKHSKSRSPRRKHSRSRSAAQRRSRSADKRRHSKSLSRTRKRRMRSRSANRSHRSRSRRSRSISRRQRGSFRSRSFDRRDRWRREPSHSPVVILRKKRSASRTCRSTSKTPPRLTELDKEQLLEIAKANAAAMCAKAGMPIPESLRPKATPASVSSPLNLPLPLNLSMGMPLANTTSIEEVKRKVTQKANSISIKELTEKCKMIAESKEEMAVAQPHMSDDEDDEKSFGGGVFRESKGISFSLSNPSAKSAVRTEAAFAKEFPVSSGSQHRKKESEGDYGEWVPIDRKAERDKAASASILRSTAGEEECKDSSSVFPDVPLQPVDITLAVSERAAAQKRLAENPFDVNAICMLSRAQEQVDAWAQSNSIPGLFTGSTGAQVLSSEELSNSGPQAWIKKDQFLRAAPVSGGVGEFLMRKMGWRAGEGLGKYREGTVEPIVIDFKTDRKGLVADGEKMQKSGSLVVMKDLLGKHPVSALMEICNKKKWAPPEFIMVHHSGPDHRKNFLFKVVVNGTDYQPQTASPNKKHAKAMAATVALQAMGEVSGETMHAGPVFTAATSTG
uniref:Protein SON-like n=1 Tax=Paramormyrops kingsleyae TaxID=1676925 RepID=A0A3B3RHW9_9TELE